MARKQRDLGNDTYFTVYNSDLRLIKDPVKKILYSKIKNWIYRNEDSKSVRHNKDGHWWTFGSYEYWAEECGLETKTVGKHLRELIKSGILKSGNYNKLKIDKTIWYRLATEDEMKNVDFKTLFYGSSKEKHRDLYDNKTLHQMYQNNMIDVKKKDYKKEKMGVPLPEYTPEYISEHISENINAYIPNNTSEITIEYTKDDINKNIIVGYNELIDENDILIHFDYICRTKLEETSTDLIKLFINRFHESNIDSIKTENDLFYYKCKFDVLNNDLLGSKNITYCLNLISRYFNLVILPQSAEENAVELTSNSSTASSNLFENNLIQNFG